MAEMFSNMLPVIEAHDLCFKYTIDSNARRALTNEEIEFILQRRAPTSDSD